MSPSKTLQLIRGRRTVRRFHPDQPVEAKRLDRILEAAVWAPLSIYHPQGWRFIALQRGERDKAVGIVTQDHTILKYVRHMYDRARIGHDEKWARLPGLRQGPQ